MSKTNEQNIDEMAVALEHFKQVLPEGMFWGVVSRFTRDDYWGEIDEEFVLCTGYFRLEEGVSQ